MTKLVKKCAVPVLIIFLWWLVVRCFKVNAFLFPPPDRILSAFKRLIERDELQRNISTSFVRAFRGFSLTLIFAIPLGVLFHSFRRFFSLIHTARNSIRVFSRYSETLTEAFRGRRDISGLIRHSPRRER